jgi:hypothetical protein
MLTRSDTRPINLVVAREPIEEREVNQIPQTRQLPVAQASPARHPSTATQSVWKHLPRDAAAEDKENAGETRSIRDARPSHPVIVVLESEGTVR